MIRHSNINVKKFLSIITLAVLIINSTLSVAFATDNVLSKEYSLSDSFTAKVNLTLDKATVRPGDSFSLNLTAENISNADKEKLNCLFWTFSTQAEKTAYLKSTDSPVIACDSNLNPSILLGKKLKIIENKSDDYSVSDIDISLTFKVKENAEPTQLNFTNSIAINSEASSDVIEIGSISVDVVDASVETEATYTVSTETSADSVYAGDKFNVDVVASADQATDFASLEAILQYDKELVKPIGAKATAINTEATPLFYTDGSNGVTTDGTGKVYLYGKSEQTGTDGLVVATYEFEALKPGSASFSIADGAGIGRSGKPDFDIKAISGAASTVEINVLPDEKYLISNADYKGAPDGKQVLKYVAKDMPANGNAYFYGEDASPLYYAYDDNDGKHVFLGFVDAALTNDTLAAVTEKAGKYETLSYTGDINRNGSINAVDSLIAYDLATGVYSVDSDMSILTAQRRLEADINNDGKVTAADARAIMFKALGIDDPELAQ